MSTPRNEGRPSTSSVRTFLIADIRGYTTFTREQGDEAASRLAAKFAEITGEGIEAWGGELVELRGDEALAVFDSPRGALRAAVELQAAFADETASEAHLPLPVGIGLDAGEAVPVGEGYRGAALNVAARLSALARAGQVLASPELAHLAGAVDGLAYSPVAPTELKGLDGAISPLAVSAEQQHAPHPELTPSEPPLLPPELEPVVPLCGRAAELRWLSWQLRRARHGHARTVVVSGPPGIGKTRLAAALAESAHDARVAVRYVPAARAAETPVEHLMGGGTPVLIVVDDLDAAPAGYAEELLRASTGVPDGLRLLLLTHRQEAPPALTRLVERHTNIEHRLRVGPLDADGVRAIAALYAGERVDQMPLADIASQSSGIPAAIHRVASQAASMVTARKLGLSVDRTRSGRRDLRSAEAALIEDVADLEQLRERARIFAPLEDEADADGPTICPYKGLEPFGADDTEYYFGRERLVAELVARLVGTSLLGLVGASGSGKSSALRAGLLPALAGGVLPGSDAWPQAVLRPGEHPLTELRLALARVFEGPLPDDPGAALAAALGQLPPGRRLLIVVDQFEEVFSTTRDEAERAEFIDLICSERPGMKALVSLRADHYGRCAGYPVLARAIGANHVLVGPLNANELAAVIERPAQRVGLRVEPELVDALVRDTGTEPGALPLLSTALLELWQVRDGRRLTLAAYHATGGLRGAVARLAESAYGRLDDDQRSIARSIFLRLAGPGEGEGVVRRRVPLRELDAERNETVANVLAVLIDARLLATGDGYIEVAHEALLREWPRVQQWLADDAAGRELRLHLSDAARDWDARGRESGDLYRGARLAAALEWAGDHEVELNAAEREFIGASRFESERELAAHRQRNRRLRILLAGAGVFLLLAVAAGGFAALQAQRAEEANTVARSHELAAYAISFLEDDPALAKLLALSAATIIPNPPIETVSALHQAWAADRVVGTYEWPADRPTANLWVELDPTGNYIVASQELGYVELREVASGEVLWSKDLGEGVSVIRPTFALDGAVVVAGVGVNADPASLPGAEQAGAYVWDSRTGEVIHRLELGPCGGGVIGASDSHVLVDTLTEAQPACFEQLSPETAISLQLVEMASGAVTTLTTRTGASAMSGDGRRVVYDDFSGDVPVSVVIDVATGGRVLEVDWQDLDQLDRYSRDLNADGTLMLFGDRPIYVLDTGTGEPVAAYGRHAGEAFNGRFAPDGEAVFSTGRDGSLHHWSARDGATLAVYRGLGAGRPAPAGNGVVLVPDPDRDLSWLLDTSLRGEVGAVNTCPEAAAQQAPRVIAGTLKIAAGIAVVTHECAGNHLTYVIDVDERTVLREFPDADGQGLALSPDGTRIVRQSSLASEIQSPAILDLATGASTTLEGVCSVNVDLATDPSEQPGCRPWPEPPFPMFNWQLQWSPDGRMVAAVDHATMSASVAVWDAATGGLLHVAPANIGASSAIFTPDSSQLIVMHGWDPPATVTVLAVGTWEVVREIAFDDPSVSSVTLIGYSADQRMLLAMGGYAGSGGGSLHWLDADTLEATGRSIARAHEGSPKAFGMSPDASLLATGSSDGYVRVWDVVGRTLVHELRIGDVQVQGLAFVNDRHLAVAPQSGNINVYTVDNGELIDVTRRSLTRAFTQFECERFNFGDDCPTLESLRGE